MNDTTDRNDDANTPEATVNEPTRLNLTKTPADAPAADRTEDAPRTQPQWVKVAVMGGGEHRIDYTPGMTAQDALTAAEVRLSDGTVPMVNGRTVQHNDTIEPDSVLVVTTRNRNG